MGTILDVLLAILYILFMISLILLIIILAIPGGIIYGFYALIRYRIIKR